MTVDNQGGYKFASTINGLSPKTTYFIRAYATNSEGTAYGNEIEITTLATTPTVTTNTINTITANSAKSGGIILADGGENITAKGDLLECKSQPSFE